VLAYLGVAVATLLLPFAGGALPVALCLAALGIALPYFFGAIANVGLTGFVTTAVAEETLGRVGMALQLVGSGTLVAGSLVGGLAAERLGVRTTLWLAAAVSAGTLVLLWPLLREGKTRRQAHADRLKLVDRTARRT
jgi:predicted MFS family arabinose efflux permease